MRIHIGGDHAAYELQQALIAHLERAGHEVVNHGPFRYDEQDDYPVFVLRAAEAVAAESDSRGVVLGGSLVLPWYVATWVRHGRLFFDELVLRHMIGRTLDHLHDTNAGDDVSFRYYVAQLAIDTLAIKAHGAATNTGIDPSGCHRPFHDLDPFLQKPHRQRYTRQFRANLNRLFR